ncbi:MAG: phosphonopyruvate decarboxylase [Clostridiales bacterium]|nr:phosphonopyruvate decarboxylase [Clostridiales bacterium]
MINTKDFYNTLLENDFNFFTGVPDSLLKEFCMCIKDLSRKENHIISANEGNAVAISCGYNIATGKYGVVYMQNSGLGNIINPILSLADEKIYKIPMLFLIGYRGEPNTKDEPQHIKQGELTLPILETLGMEYLILDEDYRKQIKYCYEYIKKNGKPIAIIVKKDMFSKYEAETEKNNNLLTREEALDVIISNLNTNDFTVSTTGKTSREIFEIRERYNMRHSNDFLNVGAMGHTSSLAFGISLFTTNNIFCIDGDGAFIMHMGGLAVAIQNAKDNFKYILINNGYHESVGGQPTISYNINISKILSGFGFKEVIEVDNANEFKNALDKIKNKGKMAIVVNTNNKSRNDLGRPNISLIDSKEEFKRNINNK